MDQIHQLSRQAVDLWSAIPVELIGGLIILSAIPAALLSLYSRRAPGIGASAFFSVALVAAVSDAAWAVSLMALGLLWSSAANGLHQRREAHRHKTLEALAMSERDDRVAFLEQIDRRSRLMDEQMKKWVSSAMAASARSDLKEGADRQDATPEKSSEAG